MKKDKQNAGKIFVTLDLDTRPFEKKLEAMKKKWQRAAAEIKKLQKEIGKE